MPFTSSFIFIRTSRSSRLILDQQPNLFGGLQRLFAPFFLRCPILDDDQDLELIQDVSPTEARELLRARFTSPHKAPTIPHEQLFGRIPDPNTLAQLAMFLPRRDKGWSLVNGDVQGQIIWNRTEARATTMAGGLAGKLELPIVSAFINVWGGGAVCLARGTVPGSDRMDENGNEGVIGVVVPGLSGLTVQNQPRKAVCRGGRRERPKLETVAHFCQPQPTQRVLAASMEIPRLPGSICGLGLGTWRAMLRWRRRS